MAQRPIKRPHEWRAAERRYRLYCELIAGLRPGDLVPKTIEVACLLGVSRPAAYKSMRKVLSGAGFVVERLREGNGRCVVVEAPSQERALSHE